MVSELAFRAQLVLREQRELYQYWRLKARSKLLPCREDIDPVDIPHLLPGLSLLDAGADLDFLRYRLAGTRVREIFGTEITGQTVFESGLEHKQDYWVSVYKNVIDRRTPMQGAVRGPIPGRDHILLIWMRLPLTGETGQIEHILGYDAALPSSFRQLPERTRALGDRRETAGHSLESALMP